MKVGILIIDSVETPATSIIDIPRVTRVLNDNGASVTSVIFARGDKILRSFELLKDGGDAIIVGGNAEEFYGAISLAHEDLELATTEIDGILCAISEKIDEKFVLDTFIPLLNGKSHTFYTTAIFKTFDKTEARLREMLKDCIKNRNRIAFSFYQSFMECDVCVRYSSNTSREAADELIAAVTKILADCLYALEETTLANAVANLLVLRSRQLALAESFTGGGIASSLVAIPGISAVFHEGIVCYSNESKITRLKVEPSIINNYGAVSDETVYEMAANLLMEKRGDIVVATSGNAGPTSEKPDQNGLCYIAVGDARGIHIYPNRFSGGRQSVINAGIKTALFRLYKHLAQNEFELMLKERENEQNSDK